MYHLYTWENEPIPMISERRYPLANVGFESPVIKRPSVSQTDDECSSTIPRNDIEADISVYIKRIPIDNDGLHHEKDASGPRHRGKIINPMNLVAVVKRGDIDTVESIISQSQLQANLKSKPLIMSESSQQNKSGNELDSKGLPIL